MNYRKIVEGILGKENVSEFEIWAFGDNALEKDMKKLARDWNNLHKDLYKIDMTYSNPREDIEIMADFWKEKRSEL